LLLFVADSVNTGVRRAHTKVAAFLPYVSSGESRKDGVQCVIFSAWHQCFVFDTVSWARIGVVSSVFMRGSIYAIAHICHGNSVCLSVCHTGGSVKNG